MATVAPKQADVDGVVLAPTAAAASQTFLTGDNVYLLITNGDGSSHTATINDTGSVAPSGAKDFDADVDIVVGAGETVFAGPFRRQRFGDADGLASVSWSATTSMEVSVIRT